MNEKLERSLIRTFRKIREKPGLSNSEIIGMFINFYYDEMNIHGGIDTREFKVVRIEDILTIKGVGKSYYMNEARFLKEELETLAPAIFYSLYLRSSFEDPGGYLPSDTFVQTFINNYKTT